MKKLLSLLVVFGLVFLISGCGCSEEEVEIELKDAVEPVVEGFELSERKELSNFVAFYFISELEVIESRNLFLDWALEEGWVEDEDTTASVKVLIKDGYDKKMTITAYELHEGENEGMTEVVVSYPIK